MTTSAMLLVQLVGRSTCDEVIDTTAMDPLKIRCPDNDAAFLRRRGQSRGQLSITVLENCIVRSEIILISVLSHRHNAGVYLPTIFSLARRGLGTVNSPIAIKGRGHIPTVKCLSYRLVRFRWAHESYDSSSGPPPCAATVVTDVAITSEAGSLKGSLRRDADGLVLTRSLQLRDARIVPHKDVVHLLHHVSTLLRHTIRLRITDEHILCHRDNKTTRAPIVSARRQTIWLRARSALNLQISLVFRVGSERTTGYESTVIETEAMQTPTGSLPALKVRVLRSEMIHEVIKNWQNKTIADMR
ncbi:hypothetical protein EVAR_54385_1 [Eumeta japonica]|uniref:Uncharacterized protein n=1 Tax=Eumeta variegata TaxID=151549 RepID=A0A4C1Y3W0_EUMVA|nr:hypothetical protein EVAR_54385_1 [Eumeta japonica]